MPEASFYDATVEVPDAPEEHRLLRLRRLSALNHLSAAKKLYHQYFARGDRHPRGASTMIFTIKELGPKGL